MMEKEIRITTADGQMRTFIARPDGDGPFPVAVIYMDALGYRDALKDIARRYASSGYYTVLPDLYHSHGDDVSFDIEQVMNDPEGPERKRLMGFAMATTPKLTERYTEALLEHVGSDPVARSGGKVCLGFCMGAGIVLHTLATFSDDFVAGSGIHPGPLVVDGPQSLHLELATVRGELYFGFAETDDASAPELLAAMEEEAGRHGVSIRIEVYPGTFHGFAVPGMPVYDSEASERHFARTLEIWDRNTAAEPVGV
jgi:carboxymethylenebutenolidase